MSGGGLVAGYGLEVWRRFRETPGAGDFDVREPDVVRAVAGRTRDGVRVQLAARIASGALAELRFLAYGCPHVIGAASWLTERLRGAAPADLDRWDWNEAATALEVPPAKFGRLLVLQDAVRTLAQAAREAAGRHV